MHDSKLNLKYLASYVGCSYDSKHYVANNKLMSSGSYTMNILKGFSELVFSVEGATAMHTEIHG